MSAPSTDHTPNEPRKPARSAVACFRCRRYRTKCIAAPPFTDPCEACIRAKVADECHFPARGEVDTERQKRKRPRKDEASTSTAVVPATSSAADGTPTALEDAGLPTTSEIVQAIECLSRCYFQIQFLPEAILLERLKQEPDSIPPFLLLSVLALSAGWTPSLVDKYGDARTAGNVFYKKAMGYISSEMLSPSLASCQGFFLLSLHKWGLGQSEEAAMLTGVAVRMLGLLGLHKESAYALPEEAPADDVINFEAARRFFWAVVTHEHLASGSNRLTSLHLSEITTLLPGDEDDFVFGVQASQSPSLPGTQPYLSDPQSAICPSQSLFATMVRSHSLWAKVAQWPCQKTNDLPWSPASGYSHLENELRAWESQLPRKHTWSLQNLRGMHAQEKDIPFLSHIACLKLAGVVLRRKFLFSIAANLDEVDRSAPAGFWTAFSAEMVSRAYQLISIIEDFFRHRNSRLGCAPILLYCLYVAGSISLYLLRWPALSPHHAAEAESYLRVSLRLLSSTTAFWPMAEAWHDSLARSAQGMAPGDTQALRATAAADKTADEMIGIYRHSTIPSPVALQVRQLPPTEPQGLNTQQSVAPIPHRSDYVAAPAVSAGSSSNSFLEHTQVQTSHQPRFETFFEQGTFFPLNDGGLPTDTLEQELTAFFRGDNPSLFDNWQLGGDF